MNTNQIKTVFTAICDLRSLNALCNRLPRIKQRYLVNMKYWSTKAASLANGENVGNPEDSFEKENIELPSLKEHNRQQLQIEVAITDIFATSKGTSVDQYSIACLPCELLMFGESMCEQRNVFARLLPVGWLRSRTGSAPVTPLACVPDSKLNLLTNSGYILKVV